VNVKPNGIIRSKFEEKKNPQKTKQKRSYDFNIRERNFINVERVIYSCIHVMKRVAIKIFYLLYITIGSADIIIDSS